ncbi:HigA family addiction module antidote protein [Permianibacter sp. IMCC34836]|uniref:HigA family addiction module antitoxin n=1 Tax=Permianibacter fluminis TaxID=2738515 RepID=UPI001553C55F|nr:HigA family addiction module antitoxin [Permianibacter fluminis]NQD35980.1 HigA family addiction module antidote protein [Permianibacter fluminis]
MAMHNPAHPGAVLRNDVLPSLELSVTDAAAHLGVSRKTLSALVNEKQGVSAAMALRLSAVFGSTPEFWLRLQEAYDLWQARQTLDTSNLRRVAA